MQDQINYLSRQINEIKDWIAQKKRQQITFPLDKISTDILNSILNIGTQETIPVGGIFITILGTDPATSLGYGTWVIIGNNNVPIGINSGTGGGTGTITATAGATTIATTINMYFWKRTS